MRRNRKETADIRKVAQKLGVPEQEVSRAVGSFFGSVLSFARALPLDDGRKIFLREKFSEYARVWNIPSIGRLGPVYSRYRKWRANESRTVPQEARARHRSRVSQEDIEAMAADILAGKEPSPVKKRKPTEMYNRVWLVGKDGKRLARQVIPKEDR